MRRRALLASIIAGTAGLAGCSTLSGDGPGTDGPETSRGADRPTGTSDGRTDTSNGTTGSAIDPDRRPDGAASVVDAGTEPWTYAYAPTVARFESGARVVLWFEAGPTAERPAHLRGWLENADDAENAFRVRELPVVGSGGARRQGQTDADATLRIVPTGDDGLATAASRVVRDDAGYWRLGEAGSVPETATMGPGERIPLDRFLVGEGREPGLYRFGPDEGDPRVTVWNANSPGPTATSRFAGRSVPDVDDRPTAWFHDAGRTTRAYVRPSAERLDLDGQIDFTMVNNSRERLQCGHWDLYKLVEGSWFHVAPLVHLSDCRRLFPGGRVHWSLRAFNREPSPGGSDSASGSGLTQGYLGGGTYGVVAGYGTETYYNAALVELVGDPAPLVPTESATFEREGKTVVVTTAAYDDDSPASNAEFTILPADVADERVIVERLMATASPGRDGYFGDALRNGLAATGPEVARVLVRTDEAGVRQAVGEDRQSRRIRFRDRAYELVRGRVGD